jgi:hypothetical protein
MNVKLNVMYLLQIVLDPKNDEKRSDHTRKMRPCKTANRDHDLWEKRMVAEIPDDDLWEKEGWMQYRILWENRMVAANRDHHLWLKYVALG